jgi:hypothetical protein
MPWEGCEACGNDATKIVSLTRFTSALRDVELVRHNVAVHSAESNDAVSRKLGFRELQMSARLLIVD